VPAIFLLVMPLQAVPLSAGAAWAQPAGVPETEAISTPAAQFEEWAKVSARAESVLDAARASNEAFEELRTELVRWRARFLAEQDVNSAKIAMVRDQIAALGPLPAEGTTEPEEISARRSALAQQLADLQAPGLRAGESYRQADGLIREIDRIIRARAASELQELGPSPLNPANWNEAAIALSRTAEAILRETSANAERPLVRSQIRDRLPVTLFLYLLAAALLLRGRAWTNRAIAAVSVRRRLQGHSVHADLLSIGQVILPAAGIVLLTTTLEGLAVLGVRGSAALGLLPAASATFLAAAWLAGRAFPGGSGSIFACGNPPAASGAVRNRVTIGLLGIAVALEGIIGGVAAFEHYAPAATASLLFPVICVAGLLLARLGQVLLSQPRDAQAESDHPYRRKILKAFGQLAMGAGLGGPVLGAIGYMKASEFLVFSSVNTLALVAVVLILQRIVTDLYDLLVETAGAEAGASHASLVPVLTGMVLSFASIPALALIWGARVADVTEVWTRISGGFTIGGTHVSPMSVVTFATIMALGYTATRMVQGTLRSTVLPKTRIDQGGQTALVSGVGYVGILLSIVIAVTGAGIDLSSLAIVAGALSVGIGFGLQTIVSNFVSGVILLIERPVSQGDWIEVGGVMGIVKDISVRSTRIETFDRTDVIVPNSDLISGTVTNWTRQNLTGRVIIRVGVAYGSDTRKVAAILMEIAEAQPLVMINPPPSVVFMGFGASSLDFELRVILRDINYGLSVRTDLNHEIARRFAEDRIEIPFAQQDIWIRNPEALRSAPAERPAGTETDMSGSVCMTG